MGHVGEEPRQQRSVTRWQLSKKLFGSFYLQTSLLDTYQAARKRHIYATLIKNKIIFINTLEQQIREIYREQGWCSGESTCLPPTWPGFDSWTRRHMWVEFIVGSRPCSEGFSPGTPVFLPPQKQTFPNFNSTWKQWMEEPPRGIH